MPQTSFDMDARTQKALNSLKDFFGVKSNAAVIKRALALAQVAAENSDENKNLTIISSQEGKEKVEKIVILAD